LINASTDDGAGSIVGDVVLKAETPPWSAWDKSSVKE
jgi:hypothetical protein